MGSDFHRVISNNGGMANKIKKSQARPLAVPAAVKKTFLQAKKVRVRAYAPYSRFKVGSALLTQDGRLYAGCNVENASYGGTVCAERVAILKAVSEGVSRFTDIVVVTDAAQPAFPCAFCLQVMAEFFAPETRVWVGDTRAIRSVNQFSELLPKPFGPRQLKAARR